jgi:hypothetical protein
MKNERTLFLRKFSLVIYVLSSNFRFTTFSGFHPFLFLICSLWVVGALEHDLFQCPFVTHFTFCSFGSNLVPLFFFPSFPPCWVLCLMEFARVSSSNHSYSSIVQGKSYWFFTLAKDLKGGSSGYSVPHLSPDLCWAHVLRTLGLSLLSTLILSHIFKDVFVLQRGWVICHTKSLKWVFMLGPCSKDTGLVIILQFNTFSHFSQFFCASS